jgi:hypothetical protein
MIKRFDKGLLVDKSTSLKAISLQSNMIKKMGASFANSIDDFIKKALKEHGYNYTTDQNALEELKGRLTITSPIENPKEQTYYLDGEPICVIDHTLIIDNNINPVSYSMKASIKGGYIFPSNKDLKEERCSLVDDN